jgi:hypothetical protein
MMIWDGLASGAICAVRVNVWSEPFWRMPPLLAVLAASAVNYQPAAFRFQRKSWAGARSADDGTAGTLAVPSLFLAVPVQNKPQKWPHSERREA